MQFIRLPKAIDIAERVLPELVADWMNTKSMQNIDISFVQKLQVNMLISWVVLAMVRGYPAAVPVRTDLEAPVWFQTHPKT